VTQSKQTLDGDPCCQDESVRRFSTRRAQAQTRSDWKAGCGSSENRLARRQFELEITTKARRLMAEHGFDPRYGARPLRRHAATVFETTTGGALTRGDIAAGARSG
jgi:hypothetical protein